MNHTLISADRLAVRNRYAYDATWTLAFALNASLEELALMNLTLADYDHFSPASKVVAGVVQQHVSRLEFTGVSVSWCVCIHTNTQILPMGTCASFQVG